MMIRTSHSHGLCLLDFKTIKGFSPKLAIDVAPILDKYLYIVTEGIHGGYDDKEGNPVIIPNVSPNQNGDYFHWKDLKGASAIAGQSVYQTWINKPVLENHNSSEIRGEIIDTFPDNNRLSIDMVDAIDKEKFPMLCKDVEDGRVTDTSMGVIVGKSICSLCGNLAYDESEWCNCLRYRKGQFDQATGKLIFEINQDLSGLEDSIITQGWGADESSKIRQVLASDRPKYVVDDVAKTLFNDFCTKLGVSKGDFLVYMAEVMKN